MTPAPNPIIADSPPEPPPNLLAEVRALFHKHPTLAHRGPEAVARTLRKRGIETSAADVEIAIEVLTVEDGELLP